MKMDLPVLPANLSPELRNWVERASQLLNQGVYAPKQFTSVPALGDMNVGELAWGNATGAGGEHEIFIKVSSTVIGRWLHDATIT
jgi:hypothetical protein